ncbi:hypothetical protein FRB94_001284 [Tulasnella sp. JGI-2019a]|nr:hypothetical protein FRB93_007827 [Tulasnella sp. JGI-2019a]KAG9013722.1 hypothetical protein FRB94_001284 [Tulasnella sp. JGI-2019a]KAG9037125.1 hypothetical protein FRB95_006679 [Tulasnella sp. JGI-2019a]
MICMIVTVTLLRKPTRYSNVVMAAPGTKRVTLNPKAGFVVKTTSVEDGIYKTLLGPTNSPPSDSVIEPSSSNTTVVKVTKGYKIFLNLCYDHAVPPPPERTEDQIRKAMLGADLDGLNGPGQHAYFVPVIVSDGRPVTDKAGKPSLVFDCVFNAGLKGRVIKDVDYRTFLIELALERAEDKSGLTLSREIATPNLLSKGDLKPRTVLIPSILPTAPATSKPLIEEIKSSTPTPASAKIQASNQPVWSAEVEKNGVSITVQVPKLTRQLIANKTTLDVEAHRIILNVQQMYELDLRLNPTSGKLSAVSGKLKEDSPTIPTPSSTKGLDPDSAQAEWKVNEGVLGIKVRWRSS